MTSRRNPAFAFWLDYLDSRGGLWEPSGEAVLTVLPDQLAAAHDLPESTLITDDPDIAREDGVQFLGAGHPEIDSAAGAVIDAADVGTLTLPHGSKPMSTEDLLALIRDRMPVDHGRIDATGAPIRTHRATLRLGALVSHTVSAEEQFTEVSECMLDVASLIAWPEHAAARVRDVMAATDTGPARHIPGNALIPALAATHSVLDEAAVSRGRVLAQTADAERAAETTRANEYYAAALAAIEKRRTDADPDRAALLDARAQATIAERDRRLAEIGEKYRHQHKLRPYRLHIIDLPAWRLATDIRRGDRRWPVVFDYLPLLGDLAPTRCPNCDVRAPLVATKTHLGCSACSPVKTTPPPAAPSPPSRNQAAQPTRENPGKTPKTVPTKEKAAAPPRADRKQPVAQPVLPGKAEELEAAAFWNYIGAGENRKLARLIAPDSPLAALTRLYGSAGALRGIGVPTGHTPMKFTCQNYDHPVSGQRGGTAGTLYTDHGTFPYLLLWSPDRLLEEIFPYAAPWHLGMAARMRLKPITHAPPAHHKLDTVAGLLLDRTTARHGLTFTARCLAAWWRLPSPEDLLTRFSPRVIAATVDRAIRYWSGTGNATYPDAAVAFNADESAVRKATAVLQKQLRLDSTRNW
ncbi:hypothetical protein [Saccharopolyspora spinosa]|uniref:Uncharacterized protein n=1 Tax=Saccharopolyspora spinosa TaxID=60894 RepID=A0A2N3XY73_SACSN|nr:hypothetical protein [Saccharopolyspora spinosa]PKW15655.1 hypothetical protein A8926_3400 [Saccharopolyspora spinosa]